MAQSTLLAILAQLEKDAAPIVEQEVEELLGEGRTWVSAEFKLLLQTLKSHLLNLKLVRTNSGLQAALAASQPVPIPNESVSITPLISPSSPLTPSLTLSQSQQ